MIVVVAVLFGCAALGGVLMLTLRLKGGNPPLALATLHGLFAAGGLVALGVLAVRDGLRGSLGIAFLLLLAAAAMGATIAYQHRKGGLISLGGVFVHVLTVFLGLTVLAAGLLHG